MYKKLVFIRYMEIGGANRQKYVLEYGWKAYDRVKEFVLRDLSLLNGVGEKRAKKINNAEGV